ncbi:unnamed protein product [Dracunculus medinensis]|uniref:Glycosylphosphatidylinositol anchor attachment 1 protein n=1 Tax=Dracunculus medinensis TaxID=318479 RepID=A0A158Q3Q8_DRAME|nr:unnamed protein product [Dracunculus medinensis]
MRSLSESIGKRPWILIKIVDKWKEIGVLSILSCFLYVIFLMKFSEKTRISENALLPALVNENFQYSHHINAFVKHFHNNYNNRENRKYIENNLEMNGIKVQQQSFSLSLPFFNYSGINIIGTIRANRSPSVESILLAVPLEENSIEAMSTALALAIYCREQIYWARDVIFVFVDGNIYGMAAYLSAHHGTTLPFMKFDRIKYHSGSIVGAFVINATGSVFDTMDIKYNMINGQLPNLDLINLMVRLADKFSLTSTVFNHEYESEWLDAMKTLKNAVVTQAFINNEGIHSIFGLFGIQAVTIHLKNIVSAHANLHDLACICEGALRSLNNIIEKFHQSYFLYILPNCRHFISVAYYMPAIGLLLLPLIVRCLKEWFSIGQFALSNSYFWIHLIAFTNYIISSSLLASAHFYIYHHFSLFLLFVPYYLEEKYIESTRFIFLLEVSLILGSLSLLNFSLAFIISLIVVPVILFFSAFAAIKQLKRMKPIFGYFINPVILSIIFLLLFAEKKESLLNNLSVWINEFAQMHLLFGSIIYPILFVFLIPIWNILSQIFYACN